MAKLANGQFQKGSQSPEAVSTRKKDSRSCFYTQEGTAGGNAAIKMAARTVR